MISIKMVFDLLERAYKTIKEAKKGIKQKETLYIELKSLSEQFISKLDMTYKNKSVYKGVSLVDRGISLRGSGEESIKIKKEDVEYLTWMENSFNEIYSNGKNSLDSDTIESLKNLTLKMEQYRRLHYTSGEITTSRLYNIRKLTSAVLNKVISHKSTF